MANRGIEIKSTIQASQLGNAKAVHALPEGDKSIISLGTIFGKATGISCRHNPMDENVPAVALTGIFEAVPSDPNATALRGQRLFLPSSVQGIMVQAVLGGAEL